MKTLKVYKRKNKVYERKNREHIGTESNSVMEPIQVPIPQTPAKKTLRQHNGGNSRLTASKRLDDENKEKPIIAEHLSAKDNDEKGGDGGGLTDTIMESFGSIDLNKPAQEELETEIFAKGFMEAMLQTENDKNEEVNISYFENSTCGFRNMESSFMPESISQYNLKNQELVDCKYSIADTNYMGNLKRKQHGATPERPQKRLKRLKKNVFRPKVVRNLGKPILRMETKTPIKKNKKFKPKTPKMKKKKISSTINLNHAPVPLEPIVLDRECSGIDIEKHSKDGIKINIGADFDLALQFLKKKKRTTRGKRWQLKDYGRAMEPNLLKIIKKKRMGRKRGKVDLWQKIAGEFPASFLKKRSNKKGIASFSTSQKNLYNVFDTTKQLSPCFLTQLRALKIEENLTEMISLLESDCFELVFKALDILEENVSHESNHGRLICYQENEKLTCVEAGIVTKVNGEHTLVATTKRKGRRQEKLEKLEHGELAHPWKLHLLNVVEEGNKHDQENSTFWDKEREFFRGRVNLFLQRMRIVQGNRHFSEWDGSVMDSIIGVFLTQNVSDHLSSSAFMSLAAAFPYQPNCNQKLIFACPKSCYEQSRIVKTEEFVEIGISKARCEQLDDQIHGEDINSGTPTLDGCNMVFDKESFTQEVTRYVDMSSDRSESLVGVIKDNSLSYFNEEKRKGRKLRMDWEYIKRKFEKKRDTGHSDSVNWEAVRQADEWDIAEAIKMRGQHNTIASRIKKFLNDVNQEHNELNLEWLRWAPDNVVRKYLTNIEGIGLKSVECVRLLALKQIAFPVDVNVGRIVIRLGWVPMQPLPVDVQIHLLEEMPVMDHIQKYLWPRLRLLTFKELYELHYHLITFGKVYCTKRKPNCQSCPMKNECKYALSANAREKHVALPKSMEKQGYKKMTVDISNNNHSSEYEELNSASQSYPKDIPEVEYEVKDFEPIIEEPVSPRMSSQEPEYVEIDIEDLGSENPSREYVRRSSYMTAFREIDSSAVVPFMTSDEAYFIRPDRLKVIHRLRTRHSVYVMKNTDYLYNELKLERRHPNDGIPYLFAMCTPVSNQMENISQALQDICSCDESKDSLCDGEKICFACTNPSRQVDTVQGTILIPSRTAMRGSFPLNGTYFQINEVFADHESSINPIAIRRDMLHYQTRQYVYFGTSPSRILKGLSTDEVAACFKDGFICVRAFNQKSRRPEDLSKRFHISTATSKEKKKKSKQFMDD